MRTHTHVHARTRHVPAPTPETNECTYLVWLACRAKHRQPTANNQIKPATPQIARSRACFESGECTVQGSTPNRECGVWRVCLVFLSASVCVCLRLSASVCVCLSALSVVCVRGCGAELCCLSSVFLMTHREFLQLHQQILHTCANDTTVRSNVRAHASTQSQSTTEGASVHPIPHSLTPSLTCLLPAFGWLILSTSTLH